MAASDLVSLTPEQQLLLSAVRVNPSQGDRIRELVQRGLDWPALRQMAMAHGVMPLVYTRLKTIGDGTVPTAEMERWRKVYAANVGRNMLMTGELLRVLRLFEANGITAIPFKGPALAETAYGDVAMRQFSDLDIFVPEQDGLKARDVLLHHGYPLQHALTARQEKAHVKCTCEFTFLGRRKACAYSVDLHFRLAAHYLARRLDSEGAFARRQPGKLSGHTINVLAADDLLLYLCLHGTVHLWTRLSYICDVGQLVAASPGLDWGRLLHQAEETGLQRILLLGLALARDIMAVELPPEVESLAQKDHTLQALQAQVQTRLLRQIDGEPGFVAASLFHLRAKERVRDKLSYVLIRALSPTIEDWRRVDLPDRFYFLYYLVRPLRLVDMGLVRPLMMRIIGKRAGLPATIGPDGGLHN